MKKSVLKIILISFLTAVVIVATVITSIVIKSNNQEDKATSSEYTVSENTNESRTTQTTQVTSEATNNSEGSTSIANNSYPSAKFSTTRIVDYDNMQFAVNGKVYTLGKTTLQDMLNDNVPFCATDEIQELKNKKFTNLRANISDDYYIDCGDIAISARVMFEEPKGKEIPFKDWVLVWFEYDVINPDKESIISFPFQLDITAEDLKNDAGKPNSCDEYWYEYKENFEKLVGVSPNYYEFHFSTNHDNLLDKVVMSYGR